MTDFDLYFSEHFGVDPAVLEKYGASDIRAALFLTALWQSQRELNFSTQFWKER